MKVHHIGYLVKKLNASYEEFLRLGYRVTGEVIYDAFRDVDICFMEKDGYVVELVSPKSKESVVYHLMDRYKNSSYHICYETDSFAEDLQRLSNDGYMVIAQPCEAPALDSRKVAFLVNPFIGIIELLEGGN